MSRIVAAVLCACVVGAGAGFFLPFDEIARQAGRLFSERDDTPLVLPARELPGKAAVIAFLRERRYDELDRLYGLTLAADQRSATDDLARFSAFAYADPALQPALDSWVATHESSSLPLIARGRYYLHLAYTVRGDKFRSETSTGQFKEMQRLLALAATDFQRSVEIGPPSVAAYEGLIDIAVTEGARHEAKVLLDRALAATDNPLPLHLAFMEGLEPQWGGRRGAPLEYWEGLRRGGTLRHSDRYLDFVAAILRAEEACRANDCAGGVAYYEEALSLLPERKGIVGHARALAALNRYEEALEVLNAGLQRAPDSPDRHELKAIILAALERYEEAQASIQEALKLNPYDPNLLMSSKYVLDRLEAVKQKAGDTTGAESYAQQADRDVEKAMVYGTFRSDVQLARGRTLLGSGAPREEAYAAFREAMRLAPHDPEYVLHYGNALAAADDCSALQVFRRFEKVCKKEGSCSRYTSMDILTGRLEQQCDKSDAARRKRMVPSILAQMESCKADYEELSADAALARCTEKAKSGDSAAAFDLGVIHSTGYGVDFDDSKAVHWLEVAAEHGHLMAKITLGTFIYQGVGTERDAERGLSLIREAAEAGDTMAMFSLGLIYLRGANDDQDLQESRRWLVQAANLGSKEAQRALDRFFGAGNTGQ